MKFSSKAVLGLVFTAVANNASVNATCIQPAGIGASKEFAADFVDAKLAVTQHTFLFQPIAEELFKYIGANFEQLAPPAIRAAQIISMAFYNAASKYDENALDATGLDKDKICQPTTGTEAEKVQLKKAHEEIACAFTIAKVAIELFPELEPIITGVMTELDLPLDTPDAYTSEFVGSPRETAEKIVEELIPFVENDGWNAFGDQEKTYNKIPYEDFKFTDPLTQETRFPYNYETEESVLAGPGSKRNLRRLAQRERQEKQPKEEFSFWKPQMSSDGFGQICMEQHVTPQIGATGRLYGIDTAWYETKSSPIPDVASQSPADVIAAMAPLILDDVAKMKAQMFDDPTILLDASSFTFGNTGLSEMIDEIPLLDIASGFLTVATSVYDACLLAYRDKILFNLARPEQLVQEKLAGTTIWTYAGPTEDAAKTIKAEEFKPFLKTFPSAAYPSAHSTMYKAAADALEIITGSDNLEKFEIKFAAGSSKIQPWTNPVSEVTINFNKFSQIAQEAGDFRMAAGVIFPQSATAGQGLAAGLAPKIYNKVQQLLAGNADGALAAFEDRQIRLKENKILETK